MTIKHRKIAALAISAASLLGIGMANPSAAFSESSNNVAAAPLKQVLRQEFDSSNSSAAQNNVIESSNTIYSGQSIQVAQFTIGVEGLTKPSKWSQATATVSVSSGGTTQRVQLTSGSSTNAPMAFGASLVNLSVLDISTGDMAAQQYASVQAVILNNVKSSQTDPNAHVGATFTQESPFTVKFTGVQYIRSGRLFTSPLNEANVSVFYNGYLVSTASLGGASQFNDLMVAAGNNGSSVNVYVPYVSERINSTNPSAYIQVTSSAPQLRLRPLSDGNS